MTAFVYTARDQRGQPLYVGVTCQPNIRMASHARRSDWYEQSANIDFQEFPTREEALAAETDAIQTMRPAFNVQNNPDLARDEDQWCRVNLNVQVDTKKAWKLHALKQGLSLSELITVAVQAHIEDAQAADAALHKKG